MKPICKHTCTHTCTHMRAHTDVWDVLLLLLSWFSSVFVYMLHVPRHTINTHTINLQTHPNDSLSCFIYHIYLFIFFLQLLALIGPSRACPCMPNVLQQHFIQNIFLVILRWKWDKLSFTRYYISRSFSFTK